MSNTNNYPRTTGLAGAIAVAMVALLAACSQSHVEPAADAATLNVPASSPNEAAASDLPEVVIVASRNEPRTRG